MTHWVLVIIATCALLGPGCSDTNNVLNDAFKELDGVSGDATKDGGADKAHPDASKPGTVWAVSAWGGEEVIASSIAVDSDRNSYITGYFIGTATFGLTTLTSRGAEDVFVAKLDPRGKFLWATSAGGTSWDIGFEISVDRTGNSYLTGSFEGTATFGTTALTSKGRMDVFITKVSPTGKFLWAFSVGGASLDKGYTISVDHIGNSYLTGYFHGTAAFGSTTLTSKGGQDVFVAKMDSSGKFLWATSAGGASWDEGNGISVDSTGNSYVTGYFEDTAAFGTRTLTTLKGEIFVAKLDPMGKFLWVTSVGGDYGGGGNSISVDLAGNSYLTGAFWGTAIFGSTTITSSFPYCMGKIHCYRKWDAFVAKLAPSGTFLWVKTIQADTSGSGIIVDSHGNSYVTGNFNGYARLGGSVDFGSTTLKPKGLYDVFLAKLDPYGMFLWATSAGGVGGLTFGTGISLDSEGNSYVAGYFRGTTVAFGSTTLTAKGDSTEAFVWKYCAGSP